MTVCSQQSRLRLRSALTLSEVVPLRGSKLRVAATIGEESTLFYGILFYLEVTEELFVNFNLLKFINRNLRQIVTATFPDA
ncbi:MAG: hypothetical protein FWK04_29550 [Nostoc sp. GBBB01]|nr:hypothetical protein [Nostoc sp. GBBB01]